MGREKSFDLLQLFGQKQLNDIQQRLSRITRLGFVTVNYQGEPMTEYTGFCDFCGHFRQDEELSNNCVASDAMSSIQAAILKKPLIYVCPCGLMEISIPIVVNKTYLGGFLCGQARCSNPPEDILRMKPFTERNAFLKTMEKAEKDLEKLLVFEYRHFEDIAGLVNLVITLLCENKIHQLESEKSLRDKISRTVFLEQNLQEFFNLFQETDYRQIMRTAASFSRKLFEEEPDSDVERMEILISLAKFLNMGKGDCLTAFSLEIATVQQQDTVELWITQILDSYYCQNIVKMFPILKPVFSYINGHITEEMTLSLLVKRCGISQSYISRLYRSCFQLSVTDYIHIHKMQLAKQWLLDADKSISEIAFTLGYNEPTYLSKVFKKYEGVTMQEYRKMHRIES